MAAARALRRTVSRSPVLRALLWPLILSSRLARRVAAAPEERMLARLRRLIVEDPVVRLPEFEGSFALDVRSDLFRRIALHGVYEPAVAECFRRHLDSGRDVVDVGANVGFFTVLAGKRVAAGRTVLAIEPEPGARARLLHNLERNGVTGKVVVYAGAASDKAGARELYSIEGKEEYSSLARELAAAVGGGGEVKTHRVEASRLDALVETHRLSPGLIKIDVEGGEMGVLRGASETLASHRPVVISEISATMLEKHGASPAEVVGFLQGAGYTVLDAVTARPWAAGTGSQSILCVARSGT